MGVTANDVLKVLQAEIGTKESPANSNNVKYNTWYYGKVVSGSAYPWCVAFQCWGFNAAGAADLFYGGGKCASCSMLKAYAQKNGQWVTTGYKVGDVVIFDFPNTSSGTDHAGFVESIAGNTLTTIEGNTSSDNAGDQSNGGMVCRKTRDISLVVGAYRPKYGSVTVSTTTKTVSVPVPQLAKGSKGESVRVLQILLNRLNTAKLTVDGDFGDATWAAVKKYQTKYGLSSDGVVGLNTWKTLLN